MEDFVPYETVLKLEKKGYKGKTIRYHGHIYDVLKWLREEKKIFIRIDVCQNDRFDYFFSIAKQGDESWEFLYDGEKDYKSYELTALAGIEYVIDNLI